MARKYYKHKVDWENLSPEQLAHQGGRRPLPPLLEPNEVEKAFNSLIEYCSSLGYENFQCYVAAAMKVVQKEIRDKTRQNFYSLPIKHSTPRGQYWFKKEHIGSAKLFFNDVDGELLATSSILRGSALKWFEKGTKERTTYNSIKDQAKGASRVNHSTGKIRPYRFFKQAVEEVQPETRLVMELDRLIRQGGSK